MEGQEERRRKTKRNTAMLDNANVVSVNSTLGAHYRQGGFVRRKRGQKHSALQPVSTIIQSAAGMEDMEAAALSPARPITGSGCLGR